MVPLLVGLALVCAMAAPPSVQMEDSHKGRPVPSVYAHLGRVASAAPVRLVFALKLANTAELDREWAERAGAARERRVFSLAELLLSDPKSPTYAQWLTTEALERRFGPSPSAMERVMRALHDAGATSMVARRIGWLDVELPAAKAEQLLETELHLFRHTGTGALLKRSLTGSYKLPAALAADVELVEGVRRLPVHNVRPKLSKEDLGLVMIPSRIRSHYGTTGVRSTNAQNSQCVAQFIGQHYKQSDLNEFYTLYSPQDKGTVPIIVGNNTPPAGVEAELDIQYITAIGSGTKQTYFWVTYRNDEHPFLEFVLAVQNMTQPPLVLSISYGEAEYQNTLAWVTRMNHEFELLGLRGISILFAAGDSGVSADGQCPNNQFEPDWPASAPAVTAVGGTKLGVLESGAERVWPDGGGGFSNYFPMPSYQAAAVKAYLTNHAKSLPPSKYWNATSRAYPDVSAFASGFMYARDVFVFHSDAACLRVVVDSIPNPVSGTSCATPTFAGVVSLLNDRRFAMGKVTSLLSAPFFLTHRNSLRWAR